MATEEPEVDDATSAQASIEGYWYQLKVSVLFALDLLANKQQSDQITLEPANEEDLETELRDEPGALTQGLTIKTRKLVVQCKLRNTGPWTIGELATLLAHGKRRIPAKDLLKNPDMSYLLVTSADVSGVARDLLVKGPTQWQKLGSIPATLAKVLPKDAHGRVAVWNNLDQERVEHRIRALLADRFRVPHSQADKCIKQLEEGTLLRMKGSLSGVWKRKDVIEIIEAHGGYDGSMKDLEKFVPPANWEALLTQLRSRSAIVLTGPSGTGKTTTAKALIAAMREDNPRLTSVKIEGGPERLRDDRTPGPVIFEIEDPWGKYRVEPNSLPWNDAINEFLASASPDRMYVITSRSDVMQDANLRSLDQRYRAELLAGHYRTSDRKKLFELKLQALPRAEQVSAHKFQSTVVRELALPLELDRFFGAVGLGPQEGENEATFIHRCFEEARNQSIESALVLGIIQQGKWEAPAILWALLKARKRLTFSVLEELEDELSTSIPDLEDQLTALASTLIAGGNFRQDKSVFSCAHPRVESGLEQATLRKRVASSRALSKLLDALVALDDINSSDWGAETATSIVAAIASVARLRPKISSSTQRTIDEWLTIRLSSLDTTFADDLKLASKAGSEDCDAAELARWLDESPIDKQWFNLTSWKEPKKPDDWYKRIADAPHTRAICEAFITRVIAFRHGSFRGNFHKAVAKLSPDLTPSFCASLSDIIPSGYNPNAETLIRGAIVDLDVYAAVFKQAAIYCSKERESRDRDALLALYNRNYDEEAIEHYWESMGEDGYTASEILRAYIEARRRRGEWNVFQKHPNLSGFLWEWLHVAQKAKTAPNAEELLALGEASAGSPYEDDFWNLVEHHFDPAVTPLLEERVRIGSERDATREAATSVALDHVPTLIPALLSDRSGLPAQRRFEIALDVRSCVDGDSEEEKDRKTPPSKSIEVAEDNFKTAVEVLLYGDGGEASGEVNALLSTVPCDAHAKLNLFVAGVLSKSGQDVVARLRNLLGLSLEVTDENIALIAEAMRLACDLPNEDLINLGLAHDFARVRIEAMNAVFAQSSGELSERLLSKHSDPSSLVRKRLLNMLEARPNSAHVPTLLKLSFDTWTPDHHRGESNVSYPIAEGAIEMLRAEPSLSDVVYRELIECLKASDNNNVRLELLRTMVRHGSPQRLQKLINVAVGEGRPTYQRLTSQAIFLERNSVPQSHLEVIDETTIAAVSPEVCLWLCMLISTCASDHQIRLLVKSLAANPKRRVFVTLFYLIFSENRGAELQEEIASFLSAKTILVLDGLLDTGAGDDLSCLDELGEVQSVELIKQRLQFWFKREPRKKNR